MDYETEEQQVEALKNWWAENGRSVILGVVIGGAAIGGWQWWGSHQVAVAQKASDGFAATMNALATEDGDILSAASAVRAEHGDSLYATLASLAAARGLVEKNDLAGAAKELRWAVDNAGQTEFKVIASVRLARVLGASEDPDGGLALLPNDAPESFTAIIEEVRGDLYALKGDTELARKAYQAALDSGQRSPNTAGLNMKLDDLAVAGEDAS